MASTAGIDTELVLPDTNDEFGTPEGTLSIRNDSSKSLYVKWNNLRSEALADGIDKAGRRVSTDAPAAMSWPRVAIGPGETKSVHVVAGITKCSDEPQSRQMFLEPGMYRFAVVILIWRQPDTAGSYFYSDVAEGRVTAPTNGSPTAAP